MIVHMSPERPKRPIRRERVGRTEPPQSQESQPSAPIESLEQVNERPRDALRANYDAYNTLYRVYQKTMPERDLPPEIKQKLTELAQEGRRLYDEYQQAG